MKAGFAGVIQHAVSGCGSTIWADVPVGCNIEQHLSVFVAHNTKSSVLHVTWPTCSAVTSGDSGEEGARVAAHPFTTISPNVARGFVAIPDPTYALGLSTRCRKLHGAPVLVYIVRRHVRVYTTILLHLHTAHTQATAQQATDVSTAACSDCKPTYGYAAAFDPRRADPALNNIAPLTRWVDATGWKGKDGRVAWRRVPVVVKDVAGLVPGAYAGRGRGNAFLNDLCDADVLIHVRCQGTTAAA